MLADYLSWCVPEIELQGELFIYRHATTPGEKRVLDLPEIM